MKKLILIFFASLFLAFPSPTHAVLSGNYFGDGSDGAVTINSNTNLTVPNKSGSYDGDMVVKNYTTLTVNEGTTLTTDQPGRGLLIYVQGNAVINGTISMSARGAYANPTIAGASDNSAVSSTGLRLPILKSGWTNTLAAADFAGAGTAAVTAVANQSGISNNGKIYTIVRQGASGGSGRASASGLPGASGSTGQSGGGGGGGGTNSSGGNGSYGSSFGGGSGGGGSVNGAGGGSAITWGGAGGNGNSGSYCTGSGAGNPAGAYGAPQNGTGGTVILIVGGNLTIGSAGKIEANGKNGGTANFCSWGSGGGGATGGGVIVTLYAGSYTNNGTIQASGGTGGGSNYYSYPGGNGGAGSTVVEQIDASYDDSCQPSLTDSTHTITASCSFTNTIDGLDTGTESTNTSTLTVQSGTLTINNGYKVAAGSFVVTGTGSIAIADGGQFMAGYPIWLVDADADGYPSSTTHYPQFSAPTNGRRRNLMASITTSDCNDSNSNQNLICTSNYFGDGSDGAVTINSNTNLTVPNKSGSYDGDMVVKNYTTLTVNEGTTLTTDQPGRGLLIYVQGNAVINGTISMSARGAYANPTIAGASDNSAVSSTGLRLPILKSGWTNTLAAADFAGAGTAAVTAVANQSGISNNGKIYTIVRQGASGGSGRASASGLPGASGSTGQSGGGGGGGGTNSSGGNGSYGSSFGGGSGGGGSVNGAGGGSAITWGGAGGNGNSGSYCTGSGAGNPAGAYGAPQNGTGGTVILIVGGNLTIGSAGKIEANGKNGGTANFCSWGSGGGGATGGGVIVTLYAGSYTNNGTIQASGGTGGGSNYYSYPGGTGGAGSTVVEQIDY